MEIVAVGRSGVRRGRPEIAGEDFRVTVASFDGSALVLEGQCDSVMRQGEDAHAEELLGLDDGTVAAVGWTTRTVRRRWTLLEPDGFSGFHTAGGLVGTVEHAHLHSWRGV